MHSAVACCVCRSAAWCRWALSQESDPNQTLLFSRWLSADLQMEEESGPGVRAGSLRTRVVWGNLGATARQVLLPGPGGVDASMQ